MYIGEFEKFRHVSGNVEGQIYLKSCVHTQKIPEKTLIFHIWMTRGSGKQEVNAKSQL